MRITLYFLFGLGALPFVLACGDTSGGPSSIGESPTGTYLSPNDGVGEHGYEALDETCENTDSPDYLDRFATPMFRDSVASGDVIYLVDGSLLWAVSIANPVQPTRLSLLRLPGRPLSIEVAETGHLLVAAGDAGLLQIDVGDPTAPEIADELPLPGLALDVTVADETAFVAVGDGGLVAVDAAAAGELTIIGQTQIPGFANAVDWNGQTVYVAACASLSIVDISLPMEPDVLGTYWVPEGHAKELDVVGTDVFVAGGEALFAFNVADPTAVRWTGYYNDPDAEGFYVNAVVVHDGVAYIAAGDESVRAVDVSDLSDSDTFLPEADEGGPPDLDGAIDLPDPSIDTIVINEGDPINVGITGDYLLVLGNFRWVGERLLRILDISTPGVMAEVGAYGQPNHTLGISPLSDVLVVHGAGGQETLISPEGEVVGTFSVPAPVERADQMLGRLYMLLDDGRVYSYFFDEPEQLIPHSAYDMTIGDTFGFVASTQQNGIVPFWPNWSGEAVTYDSVVDDNGFLGFSHLLAIDDRVYAYDWAMGKLHVLDAHVPEAPTPVGMADVGQCEMYDIADFYSGQKAIRAQLVSAGDELAMLCPIDESDESKVLFFDVSNPLFPEVVEELQLPQSRYVDIAITDSVVYALGFDNNTYLSTLVRFEGGDGLEVSFDGHANDLMLLDGGEVLVADGDLGLRRFVETGDGFDEIEQFVY